MSDRPEVGEKAPDFTLQDGEGNTVSLSDQQGSTTILYFYPKDDTPGCTKEACSFRDVNGEIQAHGAKIFGVSADGVESHRAFAEKYGLNFPLLADEDTSVSQSYGVWTEKTRGDRTFMGIDRVTFAIDKEGKIAEVWNVGDAELHGQEVVEWLESRG
ncbi:MAG: thioredoxin-dependent thiol peroxidase [Thermomicrobiales bacterium]